MGGCSSKVNAESVIPGVGKARRNTFSNIIAEKRKLLSLRFKSNEHIQKDLHAALMALYSRLDATGDGLLQVAEIKTYLTVVDPYFASANAEKQQELLEIYYESIGGGDNASKMLGDGIPLDIWYENVKLELMQNGCSTTSARSYQVALARCLHVIEVLDKAERKEMAKRRRETLNRLKN